MTKMLMLRVLLKISKTERDLAKVAATQTQQTDIYIL